MNNLNVLLVSEAYIKQNSIIMNDVEDGFFRPAIFESQNINLQSAICEELYEEIVKQFDDFAEYVKNGGTDPIEDKIEPRILKLVDNYIQPILLYYTLSNAAFAFYAKVTNKSVEKQNSSNAYPVDLIIVEKYKKDWQLKAEHYITEITKYLIANIEDFPEYKSCMSDNCDVDENGRTSNLTSLYLGSEN